MENQPLIKELPNILEQYFSIDFELVSKFQTFRLIDGTALSEEQQFQYVLNGSVLNAVNILKEKREYERHTKGFNAQAGIWQSLCEDAARFNRVLMNQHLCNHSLPSSYKRFRSAFERYFEEGYLSLIPNKLKLANAQSL